MISAARPRSQIREPCRHLPPQGMCCIFLSRPIADLDDAIDIGASPALHQKSVVIDSFTVSGAPCAKVP